jgi:hypothetical protein
MCATAMRERMSDVAFRRFTFIPKVSPDRPGGRQFTTADIRERLFEGLDGQSIVVGSSTWQVRIYSICDEPAAWWLQLQLDGDPKYTITMRTPRFQTAHEMLHRLASWLTDPRADEAITAA